MTGPSHFMLNAFDSETENLFARVMFDPVKGCYFIPSSSRHVGGHGSDPQIRHIDVEAVIVHSEAVVDRHWLTVWGYYGQAPIPVERKETRANTYHTIRVMKGRNAKVTFEPVGLDFKINWNRVEKDLEKLGIKLNI